MSANDYVTAREALETLRAELLPIARTYSQIGSGILSDPAKFYFWNLDRITGDPPQNQHGIVVVDELSYPDVSQVNIKLIEYRRAIANLHAVYDRLNEGERASVVPPTDLLRPLA